MPCTKYCTLTELGTRQFCRDNVTTLSGHKVVCNCHFTVFIVATPSIAKLKNCRVPSSGKNKHGSTALQDT